MFDQESLNFDEGPTKPAPDRVFLGWDDPLLDSVAAWLLNQQEQGEDLSSMLVVVPTSNSGRRLRMALSLDGGVLSPHVMPPSRLFEVDTQNNIASRQESLWAWVHAIRQINVEDFPHLLPNHTPGSTRSFGSALALARQIVTLRDMLADGDADFRSAQHHSPEKERWSELAEIETIMLKCQGAWKLRDSVLAKREKARKPVLPVGVTQVVVACVPDPTLLASRALESFLAAGVPVKVLIHAPDSESTAFDAWGTPLSDTWATRKIDIPSWKNRLHVVDSSSEAAEVCARVFAEEKTPSDGASLALCDATFAPALEKVFTDSAWPLFDPEGSGLGDSGIMRLLRVMRELSGHDRSFVALCEFVRLPGAETFLPEKTDRHWASKQMDKLHLDHLPETVADALSLASGREKPIIESITAKLDALRSGKLAETLRVWLSAWLAGTDAALAQTSEAALAEALDAVERLESHGEKPTPEEVFEMLVESIQSCRVASERADTVLDLQGWLEISYDPSAHLILAGMHEECVPDGAADDAFVPDSLREKLGLRDSRGRFARDAFLLQAALSSRAEKGRVDAVIARFNDAGEARKPSRLLMRQSGAELAALVTHLFAESKSSKSLGGAWQRDWKLKMPQASNPYTGEGADCPRPISPSAIKDYLNCPLRFFLKRIVGMKPFESGKREMNAMDFGNLCHGVLDSFGKDSAVIDSTDADEIYASLSSILDQKMIKKYGSKINLPLMVQVESARERLRAFAYKQADDRANGWCVVDTELMVDPDKIVWNLAGHPVKMMIDRIDRHEDGNQWRVWDYKTSGKGKKPEDQHHAIWRESENRPQLGDLLPPKRKNGSERRWADVQLPLYAAFVQQHFKTGDLPQVGYINLPRAMSDVAFSPWFGFDQAMLDDAMVWAESAVGKIRAGEFDQCAVYPANERDWDDFDELAPDGLASAFGI